MDENNYLTIDITSDGKLHCGMRPKIAMAKVGFSMINNLLPNKKI